MSDTTYGSIKDLMHSIATEIRSSIDITKTEDKETTKMAIMEFTFNDIYIDTSHIIAIWDKDLSSFIKHFKNKINEVKSIHLFYDSDSERTALLFSCRDFGVVFLIPTLLNALSYIQKQYRRFYLLENGFMLILEYDSIQKISPKNLIIVAPCDYSEVRHTKDPQDFKKLKQTILHNKPFLIHELFDKEDLDEM